jgi:iron complex outermembrane receptor protein
MRRIPLLLECALSALVLGAGSAFGAPTAASVAGQIPAAPGDVIVTAQRRSQKLQRVPIAVSAYTSLQRDRVGIETIQDLAKFTPGLNYSTSLDRTFIRGVGRQTNGIASQTGVATYNDGVYNASILAASGDPLLVDRIEVLRGPQGTLYGRNAIGGAVNSISRRPTASLYAEVRTNIGNYGVYNVEGAVSGPLTDALRFRIAGYRDDQEQGYFKNLSGLRSEGGNGVASYLEGQLDANVGSMLDVWVKAFVVDWTTLTGDNVSPAPYDYTPFAPGNLLPNAAFGFTQPGFTEVGSVVRNPGVTNLRNISTNTPTSSLVKNDYTVTSQITWHTPWAADLKYSGAFSTYTFNSETDADGTSLISYPFPTDPSDICDPLPQCPALAVFPTILRLGFEAKTYFSNDLNLASTGRGPLQWIVGLYQYHEDSRQSLKASEPFQTQLMTPIGGPPDTTGDFAALDEHFITDSYAGFAQLDWEVAPMIKLTGGLRYTYDRVAGAEDTRQICFALPACGAPVTLFGAFTPAIDITPFVISMAPAPGVAALPTLNPATGFFTRELAASWSAVTGTAGVAWTPNAHSMLYAKYSRGYKAGGFNAGAIVSAPETQPEFLDDYEVGAKYDFGGKLQVNAAAFYYNYAGMQIPLSVQPPTGQPITEFFNMNKVISYGVELETTWMPVENLQVALNYAHLSATIHATTDCFVDGADPLALQPGANTAGCPPGGAQNVNGQTVPQSPQNKVSLSGSYTFPFDPGSLTVSASDVWVDETYYSIFNRPYYLAPDYNEVDLRLLWNDAKGRYTVIVYGKNVFNTLAYDNAGAGLYGDGTIARNFGLLPPATYGVELQYRFR